MVLYNDLIILLTLIFFLTTGYKLISESFYYMKINFEVESKTVEKEGQNKIHFFWNLHAAKSNTMEAEIQNIDDLSCQINCTIYLPIITIFNFSILIFQLIT